MNWNKLKKVLRYGPPVYVKQVLNAHFGKKYLTGSSIDVTYRCTLRCKHCYFIRQGYDKELSDEEWLKRFKQMKEDGILLATWVGGEPLLRRELVRKGMKYFPFNWLITNGTLPIPNWKDVFVLVSVDGTKEYYEKIRGPYYEKVKQNLLSSRKEYLVAMVINAINKDCLEDYVKEWAKVSNCIGINFDFYTPSINEESDLILSDEDIIDIIERIEKMRKEYGKKIWISKKMLALHHPEKKGGVIGKSCQIKNILCVDPLGKRKYPCIMAGADCTRCGCVMPYLTAAIFKYFDANTALRFVRECIY